MHPRRRAVLLASAALVRSKCASPSAQSRAAALLTLGGGSASTGPPSVGSAADVLRDALTLTWVDSRGCSSQ